jgi:multimeric flavodoxin WrbA
MAKRLILHDLSSGMTLSTKKGDTVFPAVPIVKPCVGCYGCWIVTPGKCVFEDRVQDFANLMGRHDEMVVVSRLVYGGFSPEVKAVLDHSIGYLLPFFIIKRGETHHPTRYDDGLSLRYLFYSRDISVSEIEIARELVSANALNLGASGLATEFFRTPDETAEALLR